jgi:hypothetical protein
VQLSTRSCYMMKIVWDAYKELVVLYYWSLHSTHCAVLQLLLEGIERTKRVAAAQ